MYQLMCLHDLVRTTKYQLGPSQKEKEKTRKSKWYPMHTFVVITIVTGVVVGRVLQMCNVDMSSRVLQSKSTDRTGS